MLYMGGRIGGARPAVYINMLRREWILKTAGAFTLAGLGRGPVNRAMAQSAGTVVGTPVETEGPYWVDEQLNRQDLLVDPGDYSVQPGLPLVLIVNVSQLVDGVVTPVSGAYLDIWHCNALGVYSDEQVQSSLGKKFLRGYQATDDNGAVRFLTVYPGWYGGRTVHIHSRVRIFSGGQATTNFTTQFFFDDAITDQVYQQAPYSLRPNRDTRNSVDMVYTAADCVTNAQAGSETLLDLVADSAHAVAKFNLVLSAASAACGGGGNPPPGRPPGGLGR